MRRDYSHLFPLISIFLLVSAFSYGQAWSGIIRRVAQSTGAMPGFPHRIPTETPPQMDGPRLMPVGRNAARP